MRPPLAEAKGADMAAPRTDKDILAQIKAMVDEEHKLYAETGPSATTHARIEELRVSLDQCWDLLRQRRALREFGKDPEQARVRPADVVEGYEQ
jgi:hypothetical protein